MVMQNLTYMVNIIYSPSDLQGLMASVVTYNICESSDNESPKPLNEKLDTIKVVGVFPLEFHRARISFPVFTFSMKLLEQRLL